MDGKHGDDRTAQKKIRPVDRPVTTALLLLRAAQTGIALADLERITMGMFLDMLTEAENDGYDYPFVATQEDFDRL